MPRALTTITPAVSGELLPPEPPLPESPPQVTIAASLPAPIVFVRADTAMHRLSSPGWFSRGFMATMGVLTAMLAVPAIICGGLLVVTTSTKRVESVSPDILTTDARSLALDELRKYGVVRLSNDTRASKLRSDRVFLAGHGLDKSDGMHAVSVTWSVADFDDVRVWQVESIIVDGDVMYNRDVTDP